MVTGNKCWLCGRSKFSNLRDHLEKKHFLSQQEAESTLQNFLMCAEAEIQQNGSPTKVPAIRLTLSSPNQKPASRKNSASVLDPRIAKNKRVRFDDRLIAVRKYSTTN